MATYNGNRTLTSSSTSATVTTNSKANKPGVKVGLFITVIIVAIIAGILAALAYYYLQQCRKNAVANRTAQCPTVYQPPNPCCVAPCNTCAGVNTSGCPSS